MTQGRAWRVVCAGLAALSMAGAGGCVSTFTNAPAGPAGDASAEGAAAEAVDDNTVRIRLNARLIEADTAAFKDLSTVVYQGRALLIGATATEDARTRAGAIAEGVAGVREVINEIQIAGEAGVGSLIRDVVIEKSIQAGYLFDGGIESANFRVRSVNAVVYLIGLAASSGELERALRIARETDDVKAVVNYVRIAPAG
jgi:osmotically-inducible protein OsmY